MASAKQRLDQDENTVINLDHIFCPGRLCLPTGNTLPGLCIDKRQSSTRF